MLPRSVSLAYFPEAELEPLLFGNLLSRLGLPLLRLLHESGPRAAAAAAAGGTESNRRGSRTGVGAATAAATCGCSAAWPWAPARRKAGKD